MNPALRAASLLPIALTSLAAAAAAQESRPNVVVMLVDNHGWGELGCYGGGVLRGAETPRLDALATEGMRLLNFCPPHENTYRVAFVVHAPDRLSPTQGDRHVRPPEAGPLPAQAPPCPGALATAPESCTGRARGG